MKAFLFLICFVFLSVNCPVFATELIGGEIAAKSPEEQLFLAAWHGYLEAVQKAVNNGAKVDIKDRKGNTPIVYAVEKGNGTIVNFLLSKGADSKTVDDEGNPLIMMAAARGDSGIIYDLLGVGANPNVTVEGGITPLMKATYNGHPAAVEMLLQGGADRGMRDVDGTSALEYANAEVDILKSLLRKTSNEVKRNEILDDKREYEVIVELLSTIRVHPQ